MTSDAPEELTIVPATPDDWQEWRDLRRRALTQDADAFGAALSAEQGYTEEEWRARLSGGRCVIARNGATPLGMGGAYQAEPGTLDVVAMWVAPEARGRGVGTRVLDEILSASRPSRTRVRLWVADGNETARRVYERAGFVATGERVPIRPGAALMKQRMLLGGEG
jgi:ribosomal protein S18 acetylase RimI-like enzyme